jgi:hypothetical protein
MNDVDWDQPLRNPHDGGPIEVDDGSDLRRLLEALGRDPDERMSISHSTGSGPFISRVTTVAEAPALAAEYAARGDNVWFGTQAIAQPARGRGTASGVIGLRDLTADLDVDKDDGLRMPTWDAAYGVIDTLSKMLGAGPVAVVVTGHGLQPHWRVELGDGTDWPLGDDRVANATALWRRWGRLVNVVAKSWGGAADNVSDLSRVMRCPGTTNTKPGEPPVAVTLELMDGAPVSLEQIADICDGHGVPERHEDRKIRGGDVQVAVGDWVWADETCPYMTTVVAGWPTDPAKTTRHLRLVAQSTRLAVAHRYGCLDEAGHKAAAAVIAKVLLDEREPIPASEVEDAAEWGVGVAECKTAEELDKDMGGHEHTVVPPAWNPVLLQGGNAGGDDSRDFWASRPELSRVHDFARARRAAPWSTLGVVLTRIVAAVHPVLVLPPIIGSEASLNLFVALVAPSGGGKDVAQAVAADAVHLNGEPFEMVTPGSGEGIAHAYMRRVKSDGTDGHEKNESWVKQHTTNVLFTVSEVDTLAALKSRSNSTLMPEMRMAYMGQRLGFQYVAEEKRLPVPAGSYRLCLIVGVQPLRAATLLDDADGGTPQRFVWLSAIDRGAPDVRPAEPQRWSWTMPSTAGLDRTWNAKLVLPVCGTAERAIDAAYLASRRGQGDPLDSHRLLCQEKVAAGLGLFHERAGIDEEDWQLADVVMAHSSRTRSTVEHTLRARQASENVGRGKAEGARLVAARSVETADGLVKTCARVLAVLGKAGDWMSGRDLRRKAGPGYKEWLREALDLLESTGQIKVEDASYRGQPGHRYGVAA